MVRIDFFTKKDAEYSDCMRYIIANTLQEYEGEVTLNQIPENKATEEEISKYGIEVYPTIIVSGDNMDGFNKLEGIAPNTAMSLTGNGWTVDVIAHLLKGIECR